ncbi:MAG: putative metal-binding motif-containing protein [Nanoarchaeota archaeon]
MKKEVKLLVSLSVILILFTSLASAGIIDDIFKNIFGGFPVPGFPTGQVTSGVTCADSDGSDNFLTAGRTTINEVTDYIDYCVGDTNYDYYCSTSSSGGGTKSSTTALFLPFASGITGATVGSPTDPTAPASTSVNCQTVYGVPCNAGRCGCTDGSTKTCGPTEGNIGQCRLGTTTCSGGIYSATCFGAVYPTTEVCDGIDNNCDGSTDEGLTSCTAQTNNPPAGEDLNINPDPSEGGTPSCTPGTTESCGVSTGECNPGIRTCTASGTWGACGGAYVGPKAETCNGKDDNCDGVDDNSDELALNYCVETYGANYICNGFTCTVNPQTPCQDNDNDGYGNPGSLVCASGSSLTDCNDNPGTGSSVHPGATETCGDTIDQDCSGGDLACDVTIQYYCDKDKDGDYSLNSSGSCTSGTTNCPPANCVLAAGDDCNDNNNATHSGAREICDGVDNSCRGQADLGLVENLNCIDPVSGSKKDNVVSQCTSGAYNFQSCEEDGLITCGTTELPNNNLDDNCDGSMDEGSSCTANSVKNCTPETGNSCDLGQQTCTGGVWASCQTTGQKENCNQDSCSTGNVDVCGSNIGICWKGIKYCTDGTWGECKDANIPGDEICSNGLDDNCDGQTDEASCVTAEQAASNAASNGQSNGEGTQTSGASDGSITAGEQSQQGTGANQGGGAKSGVTQKQKTGFLAFLEKILNLLATIFRVGHFIGQPILDVTDKAYCSDSDLGKNYFLMGSGEGLNQQKTQIWFEDFCYQGDLNNKKDKCAGSDCFLKEYYCDGQYIASEPAVSCKYGCVNGACVPDSSLSGSCRYFDKEQWKWVNTC